MGLALRVWGGVTGDHMVDCYTVVKGDTRSSDHGSYGSNQVEVLRRERRDTSQLYPLQPCFLLADS